jgi:exodeoxyribonuclease V alpha subunit
MNDRHVLQGVVERSLFQGADNGFSVIVIKTAERTSITVTGYLPAVYVGQQVSVTGVWVNHPKFGRQFQAESCQIQAPTSLEGLQKYLGSGMIKGIGKTYAKSLVARFGQDVLKVIEHNPERLQEVSGIGPKRVAQICKAWQDNKEIATIMAFLQDKGVSSGYATRIFKKYGQRSLEVVQQNPYRLAEEVWGIGFKTADALAQKLGLDKHAAARVRAGILFTIAQATTQGHLYVPKLELQKNTLTLLEIEGEAGQPLFVQALEQLRVTDKIRTIQEPHDAMITLSSYFYTEQGIASAVQTLLRQSLNYEFPIDEIYQSLRAPAETKLMLNEDQQRGILTCLQNKVTIITGGPGTGKTTLIKTLLAILDNHHQKYALAAPTGRAAKRMSEGTGRYAQTLHRLLEFDPASRSFSRNEDNALKVNFLIVDEASMIDVFLVRALLRSIPLHAHLVLLGDVDQLPSVGAGNVLNDLIASGKIPCVRLTHIFRQASDSLIIVNAHRVNRGEFPVSSLPGARKDFFFIKEDDPAQAITHIRSIMLHGLKKYGINSEDISVLVPMNRGIVGTAQLNYELQTVLNGNTGGPQMQFGSILFKTGDRVMQLTNNYDKQVFNGDIGIIESIDPEEEQIHVRYLERLVVYDKDELGELTLAYAISIHKSQGSEYAAVIVPLFMQHFMLLQRNLIYTAITRAKRLCIFVGQPKALAIAIKNNKMVVRNTYLRQMLTSDVICY